MHPGQTVGACLPSEALMYVAETFLEFPRLLYRYEMLRQSPALIQQAGCLCSASAAAERRSSCSSSSSGQGEGGWPVAVAALVAALMKSW